MFATKNGHTDLVKYFVDKGADIHRQKAVSFIIFSFVYKKIYIYIQQCIEIDLLILR